MIRTLWKDASSSLAFFLLFHPMLHLVWKHANIASYSLPSTVTIKQFWLATSFSDWALRYLQYWWRKHRANMCALGLIKFFLTKRGILTFSFLVEQLIIYTRLGHLMCRWKCMSEKSPCIYIGPVHPPYVSRCLRMCRFCFCACRSDWSGSTVNGWVTQDIVNVHASSFAYL